MPNELHRVEKFLICFTRETDYYIACHRELGHDAAGIFEQRKIFFSRISSVHLLEHPVVSALHRKMQMLCDLFTLRHGIEQLMRAVLRVRGHEAYNEIAVDTVYLAQKCGEIQLTLAVVAVGIDILTEQGYLFIAAFDKLARFAYNNVAAAASLSSADIWHYAIGAEIVAPVHYR